MNCRLGMTDNEWIRDRDSLQHTWGRFNDFDISRTGQSINELENSPSSYRQKAFISSGFHEVIILVYKNLDLGNLVADWLMIWSEFIWTIFRMKSEGMNLPKWTRTKSSTNQRPDYRGPSSYRPKLLLHENPLEINGFLSIWTRTIFEFIYASTCNVLDKIKP